jgi:membrane protein
MAGRPLTERSRRLWAAARGALERIFRGGLDFAGRVYDKAGQDDIFFLAGGIAFNVLLGAVPFLLLLISLFGYLLQTAVEDPHQVVLDYVLRVLPASRTVIEVTRDRVEDLVSGTTRFGILGLLLLIWVSTRLIGSLRSALRDVFDIQEDRGIIGGKLFDAKMVVVAGTLFVANTAITVALEAVQTYGIELLGLRQGGVVQAAQALYAQILAYAFIFVMFVLIYRFLPARRIPWRIALVSATFTSVVFELLKSAFAWYVANLAEYGSTYGVFASIVVLIFWIYYSAVVFVLGGEVGQVYELYRIRRRQRELLD